MKKRWHIHEPDFRFVENISNALKLSQITASVLVNRNITSPEDAHSFIHLSLENIRSPFEIKDIQAAATRIYSAIHAKEKILIFGDYDADGITATALLFEFLTYAGADVVYYIPHRKDEGYGLQTRHISEQAVENQAKLIVTVDCGSSSHEAVLAATQQGIDVVVIDHHNISTDLPEATAVVNPKRHDCESCFHNLSGVGMAFCVLICLRKHMRDLGFWENMPEPNLKKACDLVAIGTMADIVPLTGENRIFIKAGLEMIRSSERPGINALLQVSKIDKPSVAEEDIAFKIAPRLNASGRMDHAKVAVKLLLTLTNDSAMDIAHSLSKMNTQRQQVEQAILQDIESYVLKHPHVLNQRSLVLADKKWDEGVLGIVASKLVEKYFRPVILLAVTGRSAKGSARSIPGFDLFEGLQTCANLLINFGGHTMAAGLKMDVSNLESFKKTFEDVVLAHTTPDDFIPMIPIDMEIDFDDISAKLVDEIEQLKPYGTGNAEPIFIARQVHVVSSNIVGTHHRRMQLCQNSANSKKTVSAIYFNINPGFEQIDHFKKIAFQIRWNRWNGQKAIQLIIIDTHT